MCVCTHRGKREDPASRQEVKTDSTQYNLLKACPSIHQDLPCVWAVMAAGSVTAAIPI